MRASDAEGRAMKATRGASPRRGDLASLRASTPSVGRRRIRLRRSTASAVFAMTLGLGVAPLGLGCKQDADDSPRDEGAKEAAHGAAGGSQAASAEGSSEPEAAAPDPEAVLEAHVEAIGGREALAQVKKLYVESSVQLPARGVRGESRSWWQGGNFLVEEQLEGLGVSA